MSSLTSILNKREFTPALKPGQNVRVEPLSQFGFFTMPRSAVPEYLPQVEINLATPFTTSLGSAADTGQTSPISTKITALDVDTLHLAQYRLFAIDPGVRFEIYQPATTARFANKAGPISFHQGTTMWNIENQNWGCLPELWLYEDKSPLTVKAYNMDLDSSTFQARFGAIGFKYPLMQKDMAVKPDGEPLETIALTVKVAQRV